MTQLRHGLVPSPADRERGHLRLVESTEAERQAPTSRHPDSGLAWARAYQTKLLLSDATIIVATTAAALLTRARLDRIPEFIVGLDPLLWSGLGAIALTWIVTLGAFRTRDRRIIGAGANEYKRLIAATMTTFALLSITFMILEAGFPGRFAILTMAIGFIALLLSRWLWRKWLTRQRRFGHSLSRVVVVGSRVEVDYVVSKIQANLGTAFAVVGVLTDPDTESSQNFKTNETHSFGPEQVVETAAALGADAVVVAGAHGSGNDFIRNLAWQLEGTAAELILASRLANVAGPRIHFRPVEGLPLIHVEIPQFEGGKHLVKRAMDILTSAMALFTLMPLFALLALLIRLDSHGPALFSQKRVGLNGKTFRMLKLRSMVKSAPELQSDLYALNEGTGPLFKLRNDPRVTRLGRVLRKYSLDELPQLWNVLLGDMSLVGPRPPLPEETRGYDGSARRRLYIKPGLTGMWQINGRSDLSWDDSVRLDLYYVENWSLIGDLVILWRTFKVLIHPVGAY